MSTMLSGGRLPGEALAQRASQSHQDHSTFPHLSQVISQPLDQAVGF